MWKAAVTHLMGEASLVAMDLRGFGPHRRGCVYELETLLDTVPLDRLVFLIDWTHRPQRRSRRSCSRIGSGSTADSPNLAFAQPTLRLLDVGWSDTLGGAPAAGDRRAAPAGGPHRLDRAVQAGTICIVARAFRHP